jgi:predicted alpha/beta-fold hydrolase
MSSEAVEPGQSALKLLQTAGRQLQQSWLSAFQPIPLLRSGHLQTLAGNFWRRAPLVPEAIDEPVPVDADGSRVLCRCHWQPEAARAQRLTLLLVHGLEGSSDSRYMLGISSLAWQAGCNVIRMNMRNCGGTESWTPTLYHSGMSGDIHAVLRFFVAREGLKRVAMIGYSMGGNLVLKLAGELGEDAPAWLTGAVGVSPAMDLAASADALHEPANRLYEWHFLRNLMRRFARKASLFPDRYAGLPRGPIRPVRSVRDFDDRITAPASGFLNADDYYHRASSARVAADIRIPTLVLHALDDPFIRMLPLTRETLQQNTAVSFVETDHGGHCAFLQGRVPGVRDAAFSRHWAEETAVNFLLSVSNEGALGR